ncbi:MAG: Uma2 family endonuclease [Thioalkalivibrio sp.]
MGLALRDKAHHTYGDYISWSEETRYELVDGHAYAMAPAPSVSHQQVVGELYRQVADALDDSPCRVLIAPVDVRLPRQDEADEDIDTVVQPDLMVVCDPRRIEERGIRGAPDWIVEVLSPSTAAHDQQLKREIYERHGVQEYWLVHPGDRVLIIYRLQANAYGKPEVMELEGESQVETLPGIVIHWDKVMGRLSGNTA